MSTKINSHSQFSMGFWLIIFATINALLMTVISLTLGDWTTSFVSKLYLICAMTTQFIMLNYVLALIIYLLTFFISSAQLRIKTSIVIFAIAQLVIITNIKVYSLYHFHLNSMVANLFMGGALLENLSFSMIMWLSLVGIILIALLAEYAIGRAAQQYVANKKPHTGKYISGAIVAMIAIQLLNGFADAFSWKEVTFQNRYIPWMQAATMRKQISRMGFTITNEKNNTLKNDFSALQYPLEPLTCATQTPPNIVILVVDSLRADMLTTDIMPHTSAIATTSLTFNNHFSTGNSTRYGLFGLMYGIPGSYWNAMLTEEKGSVLFDITQAMHYQHYIYGSSKLTFPEFDRTIFSKLREEIHSGSKVSSADNDAEITQLLIEDIHNADNQKPFFGFAFFDAPHAFSLPENYPHTFQPMLDQVNYMALNNDYDATEFFNRYKTTAHFVDELIEKVYQELAAKKLLENTIVIITSDHGQEFNDTKQNYWGHNGNFSHWQTKVPLVIHWPGVTPHSITELTSHEDVLPTLLKNALGCTTSIEKFSTGKNLLGDISQNRSLLFESWTERAIKHDDNIYLFNNLGSSSTLDDNYKPKNNSPIPAALLQENLRRMSQFAK